ncbi:hypothetical protein V5O48_009139 [Marasmius crinis-equi]|uniref:Uncharacterized protein n=1 Tax=Marasmius crinis-equi TaxID=585013 RepID=A0ABR3FCL3_9AGAR
MFASSLASGSPLGGLSLAWFQSETLDEAALLAIVLQLHVEVLELMDGAARCVDRPGSIHRVRITRFDDVVRLERVERSACGCKDVYFALNSASSLRAILAFERWRAARIALTRRQ